MLACNGAISPLHLCLACSLRPKGAPYSAVHVQATGVDVICADLLEPLLKRLHKAVDLLVRPCTHLPLVLEPGVAMLSFLHTCLPPTAELLSSY